jgi:hypothetical protein
MTRRRAKGVTLKFAVPDVWRVVEHARAAPTQRGYYGKVLPPSVMFVKDEGIYLMSNGDPQDIVQTTPLSLFVAYADGYDPRTSTDRGDLWHRCKDAVGGDDFSEPLQLGDFEAVLKVPGLTGVGLHVTEKTIELLALTSC